MSAAATAAGYLYASGRLRGRNAREGEGQEALEDKAKPRKREVKVAVYASHEESREAPAAPPRPKATPKIQYRTRRWKPE